MSDHAIDRYNERVAVLPRQVTEEIIAAAVQRSVSAVVGRAAGFGEWRVRADGIVFVLAGPHVVTVLTGRSRVLDRTRRYCRQQMAFADGGEA